MSAKVFSIIRGNGKPDLSKVVAENQLRNQTIKIIKRMSKENFKTAYDAGYDAGRNGANTSNSHFSWFSTKASMEEWSKGNKAGVLVKKAKQQKEK